MASGMSNFNIKKSFVWKYGLSKLHKKKEAEDAEGSGCEPRTPEEEGLEPDLELRPQWEPPLASAAAGDDPEVPQKRRSGSLVPAVHAPAASRTMDTAVSQYIRAVAQMQGYDVAGCRSVLKDGVVPFPKPTADAEPPIYETLSELRRAAAADSGATGREDQRTLYENDDTDDELSSAPLYENSVAEQPIYANGLLLDDSEEVEEAPIYENLGVPEAPPSPVPILPPKPSVTGSSEPTYGHLEVEVRSDHGYDSYQSPTSGSSDASGGGSPAKLSPNSESSGSECGSSASQRALAAAETVAPRSGIPPPPPLPPPPPVTNTMVRAKKALGKTVSLPPAGRQGGADRPKLELPPERVDRPTSEIENKLPANFVAQLHDMLQKKTNGIKADPEPSKNTTTSTTSPAVEKNTDKCTEKTVEKSGDKRRSKTADTLTFQMARKAVAQALQKSRPPPETQESPKPKLSHSLSVPSDKPDVTAPVERVAITPGVIPPPPPMPTAALAASGPGKLSSSILKMSAPKSLQQDLKKKLEAKKANMQAEKIEPKKKKVAPKPPDRSFSLPGFGNARLDIAKAFEEFKRNEAIKKEEALMKKKKSKYVDKLDLKDYKRPSFNTGEVEEEMCALAAESADAVSSELERPLMKSFLSDDPPTPTAEKSSPADKQSSNSTTGCSSSECSSSIREEEDDLDDLPPPLPARPGPVCDLPLPPPPEPETIADLPAEQHGEASFECVPEERAEPLPPRPRPLTKKPQLMQRPVQRAAVTPPVATVTPISTTATRPSAAATPPSTNATPTSVAASGDSEVTVSGSQVIQICQIGSEDDSWGVSERETGNGSAGEEVRAQNCEVEVNTNEHSTSVISTVKLGSSETQDSSDESPIYRETSVSNSSADSNKIRLTLGNAKTEGENKVTWKTLSSQKAITDRPINGGEPNEPKNINAAAKEPEKCIEIDDSSENDEDMYVNIKMTVETITDGHDQNTIESDTVEPVTVPNSTTNKHSCQINTADSNDDHHTIDETQAVPNTVDSSEIEVAAIEPPTADSCTDEDDEFPPPPPELATPADGTDSSAHGTDTPAAGTDCGGECGGPAVISHPRHVAGHAWVRPSSPGVATDSRHEPHAHTSTAPAPASDGDEQREVAPVVTAAQEVREDGGETEVREEAGQSEEERVERQEEVQEAAQNEVREDASDSTLPTLDGADSTIPENDLPASVIATAKVEIELKRPGQPSQSESQEQTEQANDSINANKHVLAVKGEDSGDGAAELSGDNRSAKVKSKSETKVVTSVIQPIKLHVSSLESINDTDSVEETLNTTDELAKDAETTVETPTKTEGEVTVTPKEEKQTSAPKKKAMPLFRASMVEVDSAPSSLEDTAVPPVPCPVPEQEQDIPSVDDIEAQVAALRSKVMSVNNLSSDRVITTASVYSLTLATAPAPFKAPTPAPKPAQAAFTTSAQVPATAPVTAPVTAPATAPVTAPVKAPVTAPATPELNDEVSDEFDGQPPSPCPDEEEEDAPQVHPGWVSELERQFEDLERTSGGEEDPQEDTGVAEDLPQPEEEDDTLAEEDLATEDVDSDSCSPSEDSPQSVENLSIIANKAQTKHFLESRLQESLGEQTAVAAPAAAKAVTADAQTNAPVDAPAAKMTTHEPISPPPGFDDATEDAANSAVDSGGAAEEGVEFEEFDMDWSPRRPVAPPVRSYMFGEQLGQKPAAPAPARAPMSPSYRDLFTADEPASSAASVASAASLDEARQDSACGTSEPDDSEDVASTSGSGGAETMIAQEIRELRRREEELRRLREQTTVTAPEEPLSGYGSEERESFSEEPPCPSRLLPCGRAVSHQRSRSSDSLSSGHSSSGLGSDTGDLLSGRRVTVKPFEETDDDERWSYPRSAETPIEREIRLAREREDERRREQAMLTSRHTMAAVFEEKPATTRIGRASASPAPPAPPALEHDPREAALRLATGRVQEEIQEATRREIELRDEGKEITTSEETVDEKVTRLVDMTKHSVELTNDKRQRAAQPRDATTAAPKPNLGPKPAVKPVHIIPRPAPEPARPAPAASPAAPAVVSPAVSPATVVSPAAVIATAAPAGAPTMPEGGARSVFRPAVTGGTGRGLMHKFIASRGRLRPVSVFSPAPTGAGAREPSPPRSRRPAAPPLSVAPPVRVEQTTERRTPVQVPSRRVLSAEAKIQLELQAMKEREEELRRHRSRMLAKSQPDLLSALGDLAPAEEEGDDDAAPGPLSRAMSNPNLLDDAPAETSAASANRRRRSTLIDQWESRIQGAEI